MVFFKKSFSFLSFLFKSYFKIISFLNYFLLNIFSFSLFSKLLFYFKKILGFKYFFQYLFPETGLLTWLGALLDQPGGRASLEEKKGEKFARHFTLLSPFLPGYFGEETMP